MKDKKPRVICENVKGEALAMLCSHQLPKFTFKAKLMKDQKLQLLSKSTLGGRIMAPGSSLG